MSDTNPRVWIVGENNPYGPDPQYALYCEPPESAGGRLCYRILGMSDRDYLRSFERRNLLAQDKWSIPAARGAAYRLSAAAPRGSVFILLGRKVFDAFHEFIPWRVGDAWRPFVVVGRYCTLPHPSGLSRAWHEPDAIARARTAVRLLAPWLIPVIGAGETQTQ